MARGHFIDWATDNAGNVISGPTVEVRQPGTAFKISDTIFSVESPGTATLANPFTGGADGKVELYLDSPQRVDLFITKTGFEDRTITVDVSLMQPTTFVVRASGVNQTQRAGINFTGDSVVVTDDAGNNQTTMTVNHLAAAVHSAPQPPASHAHSSHTGIGVDDHHVAQHDHTAADATHQGLVAHASLASVTSDQHHNKSHIHDGADGSGTVAHAAITGVSADQHHTAQHDHSAADNTHQGLVSHAVLTGVTVDQHHAEVHKAIKHTAVVGALSKNADQSITNATDTALTWQTEDIDTDALHSGVQTTITVPAGMAGKWRFTGQIAFQGNATGIRRAWLRQNGATAIGGNSGTPPDGNAYTVELDRVVVLAAADTVEVMAWQSSGGALNVLTTAPAIGNGNTPASFFEAEYLGA